MDYSYGYNRALILQGGDVVRRKIDRKAAQWAALDPQKDAARKLKLREDLLILVNKHFKIVGDNVDGATSDEAAPMDEVFIGALMYVLKTYHADNEAPFCSFLQWKYKNDSKTDAERNAERAKRSISLERLTTGDDGKHIDIESKMAAESGKARSGASSHAVHDPTADYVEEHSSVDDRSEEDAKLVEIMALIGKYAASSGRSEAKQFWTRLFFTEGLTRMVKERERLELDVLAKHERDLFGSAELLFLDSYMVEVCRAILQLWQSGFKPEWDIEERIAPVEREGAGLTKKGWQLPNAVFMAYCKENWKEVSGAAVSQQRDQYRKIAVLLMTNRTFAG